MRSFAVFQFVKEAIMNLKESFRYQNFLDSLLGTASEYLSITSYVTTTKQEHCRTKASPEAKDETVAVRVEKPFDCEVNALIDFVVHLVEEKERLGVAIGEAKALERLDPDNAIAMNRCRQSTARMLKNLANTKAYERDITGKGYRLDNDGRQVQYLYDVKEIVTIDFDRNKAKAVAKALSREADEVSAEIERMVIERPVDYAPLYDVNDTFEDALATFINGRR
jgi:hypothetical protein